MAHVLAMRFSALGDVILTLPALFAFAHQYPEDEITLLSRPTVASLFQFAPPNVHFRPVNLKEYKGLGGLKHLYDELKIEGYTDVVDLHDVLRTKVLRTLFRLGGVPVTCIDKGRREKRALVRSKHRVLQPLSTSLERYRLALAELGFPCEAQSSPLFGQKACDLRAMADVIGGEHEPGMRWIGVAPFAQHKGKIYPKHLMELVLLRLADHPHVQLFLFGSGANEKQQCDEWAAKRNNIHSLVGRYTMAEEVSLMHHLDVVLTMDSANMHLAQVAGARTVTVWGATHPFAGFAGQQMPGSIDLQVEDMACRPCSVFGNKPCPHKQVYKCLTDLHPEQVADAVLRVAELPPLYNLNENETETL